MNDLWSSALGGALIGLAAIWLLWGTGRILGVSGIAGGMIDQSIRSPERWTRLWFVAGLIVGGFATRIGDSSDAGSNFSVLTPPPVWALLAAGLLVGYGTKLANGCTSGHGVCGIARLSQRSIVATLTFMAAGIATVALLKGTGLGLHWWSQP